MSRYSSHTPDVIEATTGLGPQVSCTHKLVGVGVKRGFHEPTNPADERDKTADLWNFEKIFGRCY